MYSDTETEVSKRHLKQIFADVDEGCLLGGWAVYLNVNDGFRRENGRDYVGSRDIDVGFFIEPGISLVETEFARVFYGLQSAGFKGQSFRMYKVFDRETGEELSDAEASGKFGFEVLNLYVDLVVDRIPEGFAEVFGFVPIDEPLLEDVYSSDRIKEVEWEGLKLRVVDPVYLVCMKLRSVGSRTRDHKRVKDVADLFALFWYGGVPIGELRSDVVGVLGYEFVKDVLGKVNRGDIESAAEILGVDSSQVSRVFGAILRE